MPAATRYFVTKLISRVDTSSARTDSIEGGSVLGSSKLVKDTSRQRTCSGSQSVARHYAQQCAVQNPECTIERYGVNSEETAIGTVGFRSLNVCEKLAQSKRNKFRGIRSGGRGGERGKSDRWIFLKHCRDSFSITGMNAVSISRERVSLCAINSRAEYKNICTRVLRAKLKLAIKLNFACVPIAN